MTHVQDNIAYGAVSIPYTVVRRRRKTLEIAVEPDSSVSVAAPISASAEFIRAKVRKRAAWILKQQRYFEKFEPRTPAKNYISGETHLYFGRQYRLKVAKAEQPSVRLSHGHIIIQTDQPENRAETKRLLELWYGAKARIKFLERVEACQQKFSRPAAVKPRSVITRQMQKRWGSMSSNSRLLLNRRLVQAPVNAIDYVITHELCHILEPSHSASFYKVMNRVMHDWEKRKATLEQFLA
jgi:predicted metal-dependent hydrolase